VPSEVLQERIMVAIRDRLDAINGSPNYWTVPTLVTRSLLALDQYKDGQFPILGVMRASGSMFTQTGHDRVYDHKIEVAVWGYVLGDSEATIGGTLADTWLNRLWDDHVKCLLADTSLGGLVSDLMPDPDLPRDTDDGTREPRGFFRQHWRVLAREAR
jgi:hypothetical protein